MNNSIKLKRIDLSKASGHWCQDIKPDNKTPYLIQYDGEWFVGTFYKVWFGLSFDGWFVPLQFDAPSTNYSLWQEVYEIVTNI